LGEGDVFGPVTLTALEEWAGECRIGPGHLASRDQREWTPVEDLSALGMDWMVTLEDGTAFGPVHPLAVQQLVQDGVVAAGSPATHKATGETATVEDLLRREWVRSLDTVKALRARVATQQGALRAIQTGIVSLSEHVTGGVPGQLA
jgi:hypothetical protein